MCNINIFYYNINMIFSYFHVKIIVMWFSKTLQQNFKHHDLLFIQTYPALAAQVIKQRNTVMWLSSADLSWCDLNVRFSQEILLVLLDNHLVASLVPVCFQNIRCNFPGGRTKPKGHKLFHVLSKAASAEHCCTKTERNCAFCKRVETSTGIVSHLDYFS